MFIYFTFSVLIFIQKYNNQILMQIYPNTNEHDFNTCNCDRCKQIRKEERETFRLLFYPVIGIVIILCLL